MATEDEIRKLAYKLWQEEGQPEGNDLEHYFRARQMLEEQEAKNPVIIVGAAPAVAEITTTAPPLLLKPSGGKSRPKKAR